MLVICLLLGHLLGTGIGQINRGKPVVGATDPPLSTASINRLIMQDICLAHGLDRSHLEAAPLEAATDETETTPDSSPSAGNQTHCAACLIGLDIALAEHGGTWRSQAARLALLGRLTVAPTPVQGHFPKPLPNAPPLSA